MTVPSGCHPWQASGDYSFFSYRFDLEWKDRVFADVSFSRIDENAVLLRTEFHNNTDLMQNCLVNYFSALEFPEQSHVRLILPEKCTYWDALAYTSYTYARKRPWDEQNPDGRKKGEFYDADFVGGRGLGDRTNKWHVPSLRLRPFGAEAGDEVRYTVQNEQDFEDAVLLIRYRTSDVVYDSPGKTVAASFVTGQSAATFLLNDALAVALSPTDEPKIAAVELGRLPKKELSLTLTATGTGAAEFDFFCITEKKDCGKLRADSVEYDFLPEVTVTPTSGDEQTVSLCYKNVEKPYFLHTFSKNTRYRSIPTGCLEDCPTARLSNADVTFDDVLESFTASFSRKHSDPGFFHNTVTHTIFLAPHSTGEVYAVLSYETTRELTLSQCEQVYRERKKEAFCPHYNTAGKDNALSCGILDATLLTNAVYPIYKHGKPIVHHTPGKRWDCLYTWDSGFIGLGMLRLSRAFADYSLTTYLSDESNPDYAFLHHGSPVPVQMFLYQELLKQTNDKKALLALYDRVKLYYDFLAGKVRGSTTARFKSNLTTTYDYFYSSSGMDDYPAQVAMMKEEKRDCAAPAISTSLVICSARILSMAAHRLGKSEDEASYRADIRRWSEALNTYSWDEESGYYSYVLHDKKGNPTEIYRTPDGENRNKGLDGVYPLIAGACDPHQTERILSHLKNEKEMLSPYGISAVDMSAGYFAVNGYWNGNVWFAHQWLLWKAMLDLGESDFAFTIASKALSVWKREVEATYYTFEMVNVVTGRGGWFHNFGGLSSPISMWQAAYYLPGTFQSGLRIWVEKQAFSDDNRAFQAEYTDFGEKGKYTLLVVMNEEKSDYRVTVDGRTVPFVSRFPGNIEITLPVEPGTAHRLEIAEE